MFTKFYNGFDLIVAKKMVQLHDSANSRGLEFNLSFNTVQHLLQEKYCYYTGVEFNEEPGSPNKRTIDRIDTSRGYIEGNVVACTNSFNGKKANLTIQDIELLYAKTRNQNEPKLLGDGRKNFEYPSTH